ncbi:MAG: PEP/pyruvate-binding domain-containing protein [Betaproteobacteria bacterium]
MRPKTMTSETTSPSLSHGDTRHFSFGTKGETLCRLASLVKEAKIPDIFVFSLVEWAASETSVINAICAKFGNSLLAIRSSALAEDTPEASMAGAFLSKLNVNSCNRSELTSAIDQVKRSMTGDPRDQILVQPMVSDVAVSGVIMTFDMVHGAPYYCIDYDDETGRTDIVTSGNGVHKSLFVFRNADSSMIRSARVAHFLRMARELESICQCATLDIEFALDKAGQLHLLQARRIALARNWHLITEQRINKQLTRVEHFLRNCSAKKNGILGKRTILAVMPDWNPAEIIGTTPRPLAASLYRELITHSVWSRARAAMGYRHVRDAELMVLINSHPYIDVRNSFNSFLPALLPDAIGEKLVNAWLDRLEKCPEFHDKVEFDVALTCLDFCFIEDFKTRYPGVLEADEFETFHHALTELTRLFLSPDPENSLDLALHSIAALENSARPDELDKNVFSHLTRASALLNQCREQGTLSFAIVARHAFIAESLLRSAVRREALTEARLSEFKRSINTITRSMVEEFSSACNESLSRIDFLKKYGHLRPGTYEITSLRYDERDDLFLDALPGPTCAPLTPFVLTDAERRAINALLIESRLDVLNADQLFDYAARAIAGREYTKFVFTRCLSDALSLIAGWGETHGLSRDDLSHLDWQDISSSLTRPIMDDLDRHFLDLADTSRNSMASSHAFKLAHIICGIRDIYVATLNRSVPNFIGIGVVTGGVVRLEANTPTTANIKGRIVCIENADPGFDWIFTKSPAALVTCFGGANSHMAVRCAEFGLPAAIGCGDQIYQRIIAASCVELNCAEKILRPIYAG